MKKFLKKFKLLRKINAALAFEGFRNRLQNLDLGKAREVVDQLSNEESKRLYLKVLKARLLADFREFSSLQERFEATKETAERLIVERDVVKIPFLKEETNWRGNPLQKEASLSGHLYDFTSAGHNVRSYGWETSVFTSLFSGQYNYRQGDVEVKVEKGDYVIEGGSFIGDTTLLFADQAGEEGRVYVYEFLPAIMPLWHQNIDLNPELKERITLVEKALWSESGKSLYVTGNGPASRCLFEKPEHYTSVIETSSIDDLVREKKIPKVDFIKMDIEGAEQHALKGAEETIRRFKPKLAISIYHLSDDPVEIPLYLKRIVPEYSFYVDHHYWGPLETVLYAKLR